MPGQGQPGRGYVAQLTSTSQSSTPVFVHVKDGVRKFVTQASSVSQLKPTTSHLANTPQSKPQGTVQKSKFSLVTQVHTASSASQSQDMSRKFVSSASSKPCFVTQVASSPQLSSLPTRTVISQPLTTSAPKHSTFVTSRLVSNQVSTPVNQPVASASVITAGDKTNSTRMVTPAKGLAHSSQSSANIQGNKKLPNLLRVIQTNAVSSGSGSQQRVTHTASPVPTSLGSHSVARLSIQTTTASRTPTTHTLVAAQGVLSSPSSIQILTQHSVGGGKTQGSQVITIPRTMATNVASGTTTYTIPASLFKQVVSSSITRPISTLSVKQGVPVSVQKGSTAVIQSGPSAGQQVSVVASVQEKTSAGHQVKPSLLTDMLGKHAVPSGKVYTAGGTTQAVVGQGSRAVMVTQIKPTTTAAAAVSEAERKTVVLQSNQSTSQCQVKNVESPRKLVVVTTSAGSTS